MKKIVLSKLWEYDTYYKVGSLHLQNKKFGWVYMNQEWGNCERSLQDWKTFSTLTPQEKGWSFLVNKVKGAIIEMSIKVNKSKKI
jgi:hypothetical protein